MVKWCVYLSVIILMQMTEIGCLHVVRWVCTVWAKACTHTLRQAREGGKSWMGTLNAINPLDNFNKGLRIMFYVQGGKKLMFLLGNTNGLSMRSKAKSSDKNGVCWAKLKHVTAVVKTLSYLDRSKKYFVAPLKTNQSRLRAFIGTHLAEKQQENV